MKIEELLIELIKFKTITGIGYDEISKLYDFVKNYYKDTNLIIRSFKFNNDESIYISNSSSKNLDVLFVGHIDGVSASESDFIPKIINKRVYGRGSFDMKGHVAVMLNLLKNNKFNKKIGLLITSDEERGGFNGTSKFINELDYKSKIAIVPDAGNNFEIVDEEKGVLQLKVTYNGKKSHSSQPWKGDNAIFKMMKLYNNLLEKYPLPKSNKDYKTSINLAIIEGDILTNETPFVCSSIFDIRHIEKDKKIDFINFIKNFDNNIKVDILAEGETFITIKDNLYYQKFIDVYEKILNKKVKFSKCESASDGRFFYSKNIPFILMNAKGDNIHSKYEYVDINSLYKLYDIYLNYINNF